MFRNKSKKCQISVELIILLTIGMVFLVLLIKLHSDKNEEVNYQFDLLSARKVVNTLAMGINEVGSAKNGTNKTVYVQTKINDENYTLNVRDNVLEIMWNEGYYSYPLITSNISFTQGESKYVIIKNKDEVNIQ